MHKHPGLAEELTGYATHLRIHLAPTGGNPSLNGLISCCGPVVSFDGQNYPTKTDPKA